MAEQDWNAVAIGIATYKRPDLLSDLLASLRAMDRPCPVTVYVIDNDAAGSGEEVARQFDDVVTLYAVEPAAGIAQARNRFIDALGDENWVVFVDDDERVDRDWLTELVGAARRYDCDVVSGPVVPVFPDDAPRWAVDGGFFERARHTTGTRLGLAATNNTLVRRSALNALELPRFDIAFSETGGSDSDLFNRMAKQDAMIIWCDEAIVRETVPHERMTWAWVSKRAERTGNVRARLLLQDGRRTLVVVEGVGRIIVGGLKLASQRLRGRTPTAWALNPWMRGWGLLRALNGNLIREYRRTTTTK